LFKKILRIVASLLLLCHAIWNMKQLSLYLCMYVYTLSTCRFFLLKVSFIMYIIEMHISYCISMSTKIEGKANLQIYFWAFLCRWRARWKSSYNLERIAIPWGNLTLHSICIWLALLIRFLFSFVFVCFLLFFVFLFFYAIYQWSGLCCWWYCQNNWFSYFYANNAEILIITI